VDANGGTVSGPNGAQVTIPPGALSAAVPVAITQGAAGAPAAPAGFVAFGPVFALTPHGTGFTQPVTVTLPFDTASVPAGATPVLYKTDASNAAWERVPGATINGGLITAQVSGFSFFVVGNQPPQITRQPADASVAQPNPATFSVTALGAPPFTFQWQRSDDGGATFSNIAAATASSFTSGFTSVAVDNNDRYRVVVTNLEGGTTSNAATLTVTTAFVIPAITVQPSDVTVATGGSATFTVVASGTSPEFQWQRSGDGGATFADIVGATNASFTLASVQGSDDGALFRARASNPAGSATSNAARLAVGTAPPPPPGNAARIAGGDQHSTVLLANGTLQSWGSDSAGALGGGSDRNVPGPVAILTNVQSLGQGDTHTLAVLADGTAWAWGYNGFGQLGDGTTNSAQVPVQVSGISNAVAACGGTLHSLVLLADGSVRAFGANIDGQIGDGSNIERLVPTAIPGISNATAIACGGGHSLVLLADLTVRAWGRNNNGQLGDGTVTNSNVPVAVGGPGGVTAIAAGFEHSLSLLGSGAVMAWGANLLGQLGDNSTLPRSTPVAVIGFTRAFAIAAGGNTSLALGEVLLAWGGNLNGQLGIGVLTPDFRATAAPVPAFSSGSPVIAFAAGSDHALAVRADGSLFAWGSNDSGQVGNGITGGDVVTPVQVPGLNLN
jgi:alpha-tubulin suppressor-like RCC1 family protein